MVHAIKHQWYKTYNGRLNDSLRIELSLSLANVPSAAVCDRECCKKFIHHLNLTPDAFNKGFFLPSIQALGSVFVLCFQAWACMKPHETLIQSPPFAAFMFESIMRRNSMEIVRVIFREVVDLQIAVNEILIWKGWNLTITRRELNYPILIWRQSRLSHPRSDLIGGQFGINVTPLLWPRSFVYFFP
jgi:hypothetical protein